MSGANRDGLPTGTVTFLRTDVEGSMRLAQSVGAQWDEINTAHLELVKRAIVARRGVIVRTEGDAAFAAFTDAVSAVQTAIDVQRALAEQEWPAGCTMRVRIGLLTGEAHLAGDDYGGLAASRVARLVAVGHGGQILLSESTRALVRDDLPQGVSLRSLGRHHLRDFTRLVEIFQLEAEGLDVEFPALRTDRRGTSRLPARLTSVIGRDDDLLRLTDHLDQARILTITGPGGVGKTTLALELARSVLERGADDVIWVELAGTARPDQVPSAIAREAGVRDVGDRPVLDGVARLLADRSTVMVLDNAEHVLDAAPDVAGLIRAVPGLRIVTTSRAPLRITGEQEYRLQPLDADGDAAARLFEDRARAVMPGWTAGEQREIVRQICRLLDGLPLGIELAAARVPILPLSAIRGRLAANLPLPGLGRRDAPQRQQTLDSAVRWSYDLLEEPSKRLLRALAVFERGFDLDQAAVVAAASEHETLAVLDDLTTNCLLVPGHELDLPSSIGGGVRFRMLDTVRAFASRQLHDSGELDDTRARHVRAYAALAEAAAPHLPGPEMALWLDRLALDHDNLHAAVAWAIQTRATATAQRLVADLWRYWQTCGHLREGRDLAEAVLDLPGTGPERLRALEAAAGLAYWQGEPDRAELLYRERLLLARELADPRAEAFAALDLTSVLDDTGDSVEIHELVTLAERLSAQSGDKRAQTRAALGRTFLDMIAGRIDDPVSRLSALAAQFGAVGDVLYEVLTTGMSADLLWRSGRPREAASRVIDALLTIRRNRDQANGAAALPLCAMYLNSLGRHEAAATLLGSWSRLSDVQGFELPNAVRGLLASADPWEEASQALGPEAYAFASDRGAALTFDEAMEHAANALEEAARGAGQGPDVAQHPAPGA